MSRYWFILIYWHQSLSNKKVPPKAKGRKRNRDVEKPLSGLDIDELLHREKRAKISPENAIPEFKQTLATAENIEAVKDAASQMEKIIEGHIRTSFGDSNYDRVVEELGVLREELIDYEEPGLYNDAIKRIKDKILKEQLGGDRQELWWLIRRSKIGLIDKSVSDRSEVTEDEAKQVWMLLLRANIWTRTNIPFSSYLPNS